MQAWHDKARHIGQLFAVKLHLRAFALVIRFFVELLLSRCHQLFHFKFRRGKACDFEQRHHIINVGVDRFGNAGILHLDRQFLSVTGQCLVHLPDAGRGNRARVEPAKLLAPIRAPFTFKHLIQLLGRHEIGLIAQGRKDFGKLIGQEIACIKAYHLAHLHRRSAQVAEAIGQALNIAGGENEIARIDAVTARQPARPFGHHAARHAAHQPPECAQPRHAACRHGALAAAIIKRLVEIGAKIRRVIVRHYAAILGRGSHTQTAARAPCSLL